VLTAVLLEGLVLGALYSLMSVGLTLIWGVLRIINFAHGEIYMLGAYTSYLLCVSFGFDPVSSLLMSLPFGFLIGLSIERGIIHYMRSEHAPEASFTLVTLGLLIFMENLALMLWGPNYRMPPPIIQGTFTLWGGIIVEAQRVVAICVAGSMLAGLWLFLHKSKVGIAIRALAQDSEVCSILGVDIDRLYMLTFGLGAAIAAASGALLAPVFAVYPTMGEVPLMKSFIVVILGGLGSVGGAMLGGLLLGLAEVICASYISAGFADLFGFLVMMSLLIFRPTGMFGERARVGG
jgi:branched-chain amino acid transport system permease protein